MLCSYVYIVANNGSWTYGPARAEDVGGLIVDDWIDLYMATTQRCFNFGIRSNITLYILR